MPDSDFTVNIAVLVQALPRVSRLLGLDVGKKRIGVALSDPGRLIANPMRVIKREAWSDTVRQLNKIAVDCAIGGIIVGYPLRLGGGEGPACQGVRKFCSNLHAAKIGVPLVLWDERLSTREGQKLIVGTGISRAKRAEKIDSVAASVILQAALDYLNYQAR